MGATLADAVKDQDDQLQVSDMKDRKGQFDVAEMTITLLEVLATGIAGAGLAGGALGRHHQCEASHIDDGKVPASDLAGHAARERELAQARRDFGGRLQ